MLKWLFNGVTKFLGVKSRQTHEHQIDVRDIPTHTTLDSQPYEIEFQIFQTLSNLDIVRIIQVNRQLRTHGTKFLVEHRLPQWIKRSSTPQQALTRAARECKPIFVKLMIERTDICSHFRDWQALDMAIENKHTQIVKFLLEHDSKMSAQDLVSRFLTLAPIERFHFLIQTFSPSKEKLFELIVKSAQDKAWHKLEFFVLQPSILSDLELERLRDIVEKDQNWYALSIILASRRTSTENVERYLHIYGVKHTELQHLFIKRQVSFSICIPYLKFLQDKKFWTTLTNVLAFQESVPLEIYIEYISLFESCNLATNIVGMLIGKDHFHSITNDVPNLPEDVIRRCLTKLNTIGKFYQVVDVLVHYSDMFHVLDCLKQDTCIETVKNEYDILKLPPGNAHKIIDLFKKGLKDIDLTDKQIKRIILRQIQLGNLNPYLES